MTTLRVLIFLAALFVWPGPSFPAWSEEAPVPPPKPDSHMPPGMDEDDEGAKPQATSGK